MLPELFIASLLASPAVALDKAAQPAASSGGPELCSYIKDMMGMADGSAAKQQASALEQRLHLPCEKITWAVLAEREPAVGSAWRDSVPKRRALVLEAVAILRKHAVDPKALDDTPENPAAVAVIADLSRLPRYSADEPLNAQSIAAWLPPEADGSRKIYAMWLVVQNNRLRGEKWGLPRQQTDPVSPERRKQIDDTLAANKVRLKKMERIEDPDEFKSLVEGSVRGQGNAVTGVAASASLSPGNLSGETPDNRPLKVPQTMRGVDRKSVPMSSPPRSPPPAPAGTEPGEDSGLLGKALGLGGAAVAGAMILWRRKQDERELAAAREEVAAEDRAHAAAKGEMVVPPSLASDPIGFAADRGFRAKLFIEEHPFISLGGVGAVALGGWLLAGPTLLGGGGTTLLTTSGALIPAVTLDGVAEAGLVAGVATAGAKGVSDSISNAKSGPEGAGGGWNLGRSAKPKNAPSGTKPIDQSGLNRRQIHDIKNGVGAEPNDWTGIDPEGNVITGDSSGNAINHGHWRDYTHFK